MEETEREGHEEKLMLKTRNKSRHLPREGLVHISVGEHTERNHFIPFFVHLASVAPWPVWLNALQICLYLHFEAGLAQMPRLNRMQGSGDFGCKERSLRLLGCRENLGSSGCSRRLPDPKGER